MSNGDDSDALAALRAVYRELDDAITVAENRLSQLSAADPRFFDIAHRLSELRVMRDKALHNRLTISAKFRNADRVVQDELAARNKDAADAATEVAQTSQAIEAVLGYLGKVAAAAGVILSFVL